MRWSELGVGQGEETSGYDTKGRGYDGCAGKKLGHNKQTKEEES